MFSPNGRLKKLGVPFFSDEDYLHSGYVFFAHRKKNNPDPTHIWEYMRSEASVKRVIKWYKFADLNIY